MLRIITAAALAVICFTSISAAAPKDEDESVVFVLWQDGVAIGLTQTLASELDEDADSAKFRPEYANATRVVVAEDSPQFELAKKAFEEVSGAPGNAYMMPQTPAVVELLKRPLVIFAMRWPQEKQKK
jgi:hypothetical protein